MKFKSINPIERHIEKLVLLLALAFVGYIVWAYIFSSSVQVDLGARTVAPSEVDRIIHRRAQQLQNALNAPAADEIVNTRVPRYARLYRRNLADPITPAAPQEGVGPDALAWRVGLAGNMIAYSASGEGPSWTPVANKPYRPLDAPAVRDVAAEGGMGTLADTADTRIRELVSPTPPLDFQWVSVAGALDLSGIVEQLRQAEDEQSRSIPTAWVNEGWALLDVEVQRQHREPDGTWSEPQTLDSMPDQMIVRQAVESVEPDTALALAGWARERWQVILQPPFPALRQGGPWHKPTAEDPNADADDADDPSDEDQAAGIKPPQLLQLEAELEQLESAIENDQRLVQRYRDRNREPPGVITNRLDQNQRRAQLIRRQINAFSRGSGAPMQPPALTRPFEPDVTEPGAQPGSGGNQPVLTGLLGRESVDLWAHDLMVEPDSTYRYRMRVVTANPLYHRAVPEPQADLAGQFKLTGAWSSWSEPVNVPSNHYFFAIGGNAGVGYATIETWKFYDGRWCATEFNVFPGDPVGSTVATFRILGAANANANDIGVVDFSTGLVAVDVDFNHKLPSAPGGLAGLNRTTLRLLYTDGDNLMSRLESDDEQRRDTLQARLAPPNDTTPDDRGNNTPQRPDRPIDRPMFDEDDDYRYNRDRMPPPQGEDIYP